jgi:hypothetical protein
MYFPGDLVIPTTPAMAYTGQELSKQAKISITEARAIALKAHHGKITDQELEKEKGGTGLRYSFDIKRGAVTTLLFDAEFLDSEFGGNRYRVSAFERGTWLDVVASALMLQLREEAACRSKGSIVQKAK